MREGIVRGKGGAGQVFCAVGGQGQSANRLFKSPFGRLSAGNRLDYAYNGLIESGYGPFISIYGRFGSDCRHEQSAGGSVISAIGLEKGGDGNDQAAGTGENDANAERRTSRRISNAEKSRGGADPFRDFAFQSRT